VSLESGMAALVLLGASMLVQTPPPVDLAQSANQIVVPSDLLAPPPPFHEAVAAGDLLVALDLDAQTWGQRAYTVTLQTAAGAPADADRVRLRVKARNMEMGLTDVELTRVQPGIFTASSSAISMAGGWQIEVTVRRRGVEDVTARFSVEVQ
jgi:copper transport protein